MILAWDIVLADCHGQPESTVVYEVATTVIQMPTYSAPNFTLVGVTSEPTITLADIDLEPGAVELIRITSIDEAGNRDEDSCT